MACTAIAMSPWPVTRITGRSGSMVRISFSHWVPGMPGSLTSHSTTAGTPARMCERASSTLAKPSTSSPASSKACVLPMRTSGSSSTKITRMACWSLISFNLQCGRKRQFDHETGAASIDATSFNILGTQAAAQLAHDVRRDHQAQSQSGAGWFAGGEGLEQAWQDVGAYAGSGVTDLDDTALPGRVGHARGDEQAALRRGRHGVNGVAQQVDQHLLEPSLLGERSEAGGLHLHHQFHAVVAQPFRHQELRVGDHLLQWHGYARGTGLVRKGLELIGQATEAIHKIRDALQVAAYIA